MPQRRPDTHRLADQLEGALQDLEGLVGAGRAALVRVHEQRLPPVVLLDVGVRTVARHPQDAGRPTGGRARQSGAGEGGEHRCQEGTLTDVAARPVSRNSTGTRVGANFILIQDARSVSWCTRKYQSK